MRCTTIRGLIWPATEVSQRGTHERYDPYWKRGSIATDYAAIQCPVYVVDGWGDPY